MERSSLLHKSYGNLAYAYDEKNVHIKLQTKADDVTEVYLVYGDPYDYREFNTTGNPMDSQWKWYSHSIKMNKASSDGIHDFWFIEMTPEFYRIRYAFHIISHGEHYIYSERSTLTLSGKEDPELHNVKNFFCFPFLNKIDIYKAPDWVRETIWYQIFPERFANGDKSNDPKGVKDWKEAITSHRDQYGGDLKGVIDHLDYIEDLGVNGIYFTPIFHSNSNHKYDTIDYKTVDPCFGNVEVLKELVDKAHKKGIKVMFDIVFNHCGFYFDKFQDVVEKGENSIYKDWFHIKSYPVYDKGSELHVSKDLNFHTFAFTPSMPKLNTENPEVKQYLFDVIRYWCEQIEIDGFRLDVANEVDHNFWREFRKLIKELNPNAYILGEVWHDANPWLMGDQFDGVMNYPLNDAIINYFTNDSMDSLAFAREVNRVNFNYPAHVNQNMYNLLDSHDTARFLHLTAENKDLLKLAYVFMMTHVGAPSVYYGNEIGMTGNQDPDNRRPMIWDKEEQDLELFSFLKKLIHIRKSHTLLSYKGDLSFVNAEGHKDVLLYKRYDEEESYYILINRSACEVSFILVEEMRAKSFENLWEMEKVTLQDNIKLKPYGFYILKRV